MIIYYHFLKENLWGHFNETTGKVSVLFPEEMPMMLSEDILNPDNNYIYMSSLDGFMEDVIKVINVSGYNFVDGSTNIKKLSNYDCKYLISGNETAYSFTMKYKKKIIRLYNLDNILKMSPDKICETFSDVSRETFSIEDCVRACANAINTLNELCKIKSEAPCTITGYAKRVYQRTTGARQLVNMIDKLVGDDNVEKYVRPSYHGGYNYINRDSSFIHPEGKGVVLDVNSLYPYIMISKPLPAGKPHLVKGKPKESDFRDAKNGYIYMFLRVNVAFKLKKGGIPCIKMDNGCKLWYFYQRDYMTTTQKIRYEDDTPFGDYDKISLTLTQSDYNLLLENYDILSIEYRDFLWFETTKIYFSEYVRDFYKLKMNAKTEGERFCYKMLLNSISGLMARLPEYENVIIGLDSVGNITYEKVKSAGNKSYINVGSAITAYGREFIVHYAKKYKDRWKYSDTDSLHLMGTEIPDDIQISKKMGDFKVEKEFDKICYYAKKCYGYISNDKLELTMAGVRLDDKILVENIYNKEEKQKDLVTGYYVYDITEPEKRLLDNLINDPETWWDEDYNKMCKEIEARLKERDIKKKEFEMNIKGDALVMIGVSKFPMTQVYSDDMFSAKMKLEWADFSKRKHTLKHA